MATTTNYGWTTPDDTDLVKDGAAAIRTLGSSADTTVKNLSPGTTAGDLDYYTSGTAKARLGIGTAGQVLRVNSGATAPEWATPAGGGKVLQVVQGSHATSVTISSGSFTDTNLTASITPSSATSKILVLVNQSWYMDRSSTQQGHAMRIMRGATAVFTNTADNTAAYFFNSGSTSIQLTGYIAFAYLDSPATTSALTYKTQGKVRETAGQVRYQYVDSPSTITLLEIGA